uniref:Fibrinogen C-terminal domain-containing protein n=1 Tax=Amphimedon queenslandica TaxID=400682 RepID=A0A1X7UJ42_AMPQE
MDDSCSTSASYNGYTPSLYHRYCCLPTNSGKTLKVRENNSNKYILCSTTGLPKEFCNSLGVYSHTSCHEVLDAYPNAESGYYYITQSNGDIVSVYCDMEGRNCDGKGGWTRVAFLNMTQPGATCPSGELISPYISSVDSLCWNANSLIADYYSDTGCASAFFPSTGNNYTEVCGQVRGYQSGRLHAFHTPNYTNNIDSSYVEGVSITHGANPRKHIWTYAVGEESDTNDDNSCPCNANYTGGSNPKLFVQNHYYCESGVPASEQANSTILYYSDALWDGKDCDGVEGPCCTNPKLPWFYRKLDEETTDDIELRICNSKKYIYDNSPIDIVEIFIR